MTTPYREAPVPPPPLVCPRDRHLLVEQIVEDTPLHVCRRCTGLWIDATTLKALVADRTRMDGLALHPVAIPDRVPPAVTIDEGIACPRCAKTCTRHAYRVAEGLVVDSCREHGMWLDGGELAALIRHERSPRGAPAREPRTFEQDEAWLNRVVDFLDSIRRISWWL